MADCRKDLGVTFFASPIGLGHASRDIAIAQHLADSVEFVTGEAAARLIGNYGYPVHDVYRPVKFAVESGKLQDSFRWLMDYYSYYKKCKEIAREILNSGTESLVVSDEDFASISVAQESRRRRILVTDITETHFTKGMVSIIEKRMNRAMQDMIRSCDRVIIPDTGQDRDNIVHVGPIVRAAGGSREELRRKFGFTRKTILASSGGTNAGKFLIEQTIEACKKLSRLDAELVVVPGPSLQLDSSSGYRNLGFVDNLHDLVFASDLVISLAGRSTMDESIAFGTPGIFIPIKGHFEQEHGAARLGYTYEDVFRLATLIEEKISQGRAAEAKADGAAKAAEIISSYL